MSYDEHSESELYYHEEGNLNVSLQNEQFEASEVFEASESKLKNFKLLYNKQRQKLGLIFYCKDLALG